MFNLTKTLGPFFRLCVFVLLIAHLLLNEINRSNKCHWTSLGTSVQIVTDQTRYVGHERRANPCVDLKCETIRLTHENEAELTPLVYRRSTNEE
jgi:hypothetical protein